MMSEKSLLEKLVLFVLSCLLRLDYILFWSIILNLT